MPTKKTPAKTATPKTVAMVRDAGIYPAPHKADVHPDEVESYRAAGWEDAK